MFYYQLQSINKLKWKIYCKNILLNLCQLQGFISSESATAIITLLSDITFNTSTM